MLLGRIIKCTSLKISLQLGLEEHQIACDRSRVKRAQTLALSIFLHSHPSPATTAFSTFCLLLYPHYWASSSTLLTQKYIRNSKLRPDSQHCLHHLPMPSFSSIIFKQLLFIWINLYHDVTVWTGNVHPRLMCFKTWSPAGWTVLRAWNPLDKCA